MTDDRSLERAARSWLEDGPTQAPDRAIERALHQVEMTSQERGPWIPRRVTSMFQRMQFTVAAIAAVVVMGVGIAAFLGMMNTPSLGSLASPAPASPTPIPPPIPDGTYVADPIPVAEIEAALAAEQILTSVQEASVLRDVLAVRGYQELEVSFTVAEDQFTMHITRDGGPPDPEEAWGLSTIDADTVAFQVPCCGTQRYRVAWNGNDLKLTPISAGSSVVEEFVRGILFSPTFRAEP